MNRTHLLVAALVVFLLGCPLAVFGGLFVLGAGAFFSFGDRDPGLLEGQAEGMIGTSFPASMRNYNGYQEGFQDGFYLARADIDPADAAAFVAASNFASATPDSSTNPFQPIHVMPSWWDAHRATSFTAYTRSVPGANETLLLDTGDPSKTVVYWNRVEF